MRGMDAELAAVTAQPLAPSASNSSISGSRGCVKVENAIGDPFPAGLRVLVVDDDPICLLILDRMLRRCQYIVTTCGKATAALEMLRENRENFDLIISDVYMPDMDGFKLLEHVGLEMDLPVIMMSANGETSAVMKGIKHGACDYLLKPVRIEELRNIWQHVVRKKWQASERAVSNSDDKLKRGADDADYTSSGNEGLDWMWKQSKKRKDIKEEEEEPDQENEDGSTTKKPRVVWSVDLHQQFVGAVNQLGIDKAVPKRILELMNVHGLTRENVASHLQKYRLYLKRISGVGHHPGGLNSFAGSPDLNFGPASAGGLGGLGDLRTLAATGQLLPQALVSSLQAGIFGPLGPPNNLGLGGTDPQLLLQIAALQGASSSGGVARPSYGHLLQNSQDNLQAGASDPKLLTQLSQQIAAFGQRSGSLDKRSPGMSALQQQLAASISLEGMGQLVESNNNLQLNSNNNPLLIPVLQQQSFTNEGGTTLPTGGILGQHGLSTETVAWASPISSVTAGAGTGNPVQNTSSFRPGPMSPIGRHSCADNKGLHVSSAGNINLPVQSPVVVSSPLVSTEPENDSGASRLRNIGSSLGAVCESSPQNLHNFGPNFMSYSGMKHALGLNTGSRNQAGWQGFGLSQEFGQATSPVPSPRYNQVSSGSRGLNLGTGQEQGQIQAPGFGMGFRGNMGTEGGFVKASGANTLSQSEQSTADSNLKVAQGNFGLLMGSKAEHGWASEPLPEGLFNVILKQQQERLGLTEGELAAADGYALDNMYVK